MSLVVEVPNGYNELIETFGEINFEGGKAAIQEWERNNIITVPFPWMLGVPVSWDLTNFASGVRVHRKIKAIVLALFDCLLNDGYYILLRDYGGSYNPRMKRGSSLWSTHSWGISLDFNCIENYLGNRAPTQPYVLVKTFQDFGFYWGGDFKRPDPMHFQYCRSY